MDDVVLGTGDLADRGVYAGRSFRAGEVVLTYRLQPISAADYSALPAGEDLFVHSFGGVRFLYPPPARFVNHSDDPTCVQDFERSRHIALRNIAEGEPITIDAHRGTSRELDTFVDAYRQAVEERSVADLSRLVAQDARLATAARTGRGQQAVVTDLLELEPVLPSAIEWFVGTGRWEALCSADVDCTAGRAHLTMLLKVIAGNWQVVYQHLG